LRVKKADVIMVIIISSMIISVILLAFHIGKEERKEEWGKAFSISSSEVEDGDAFCTIEIICGTILDNKESLNPSKIPYVPENGYILEKTTVGFYEGETVFDVLCRVCDKAQIQIEYSWTPVYDSYYVEGINHIYEFDCGGQSGWLYKVNDQFPNYGCSGFEVKPNDAIVWIYSCNGLGTDVGAKMGD